MNARAGDMAGAVGAVLREDRAAMTLDDLLRDRQAEAGMSAEFSPTGRSL